MKKYLLAIFFVSSLSFAQDPMPIVSPTPSPLPSPSQIAPLQPAADAIDVPRPAWLLRLGGGIVFSPSFSETIVSGTTTFGSASVTGNSAPQINAEVGLQIPHLPIGIFAVADWNKFIPPTGTPSDTEFGLYLIPKVIGTIGPWHPWAGFGIGILTTSFGLTSASTNGVTLNLSSSSTTDFAFTPRAGVDLDLGDKFLIGIQASYVNATGSIPFTVTSGDKTANGAENYTLNWFSLGLSIGLRL